jgi:phage antirepressor YoqD-like protein
MSNTTAEVSKDNTWMGITEIAGLFQVSRNTATGLVRDNKIRYMELRKKKRYDRAQVAELYERSIFNGDD